MSSIEHVLTLKATPEAAYQAVATEEGIRGWWNKAGEVGARVGDRCALHFRKGDQMVEMRFEIEALDAAGRRVTWKCTENANPAWVGSRLTWEIAPAPEGARVRLAHEGFAMDGPPYEMTVRGWPPFVQSLKAFAETGQGSPG